MFKVGEIIIFAKFQDETIPAGGHSQVQRFASPNIGLGLGIGIGLEWFSDFPAN